jgi:hypothetical protein
MSPVSIEFKAPFYLTFLHSFPNKTVIASPPLKEQDVLFKELWVRYQTAQQDEDFLG